MKRQRVFIVHGQDHRARNDLKTLLEEIGVEPIILSKTPDHGKTIIEKFEHCAKDAAFAIILLTPDDMAIDPRTDDETLRARQNVIFEMGWFFAKFGRARTLLLLKGHVELPSDVSGILYCRFNDSPDEVRGKIVQALAGGGVRPKGS